MKKIIIIAGPNGAGKTTFAEEFLPHEADCPEFVNADLIAAGLSPFRPDRAAFAAGRLMLKRIHELVASECSFAFETTLSTRAYLRWIPVWQTQGYRIKLSFLKLPDADFAIQRVAQRVRLGGHDIPTETIRRRFRRGWHHLRHNYLPLVDEWAIYDSSHSPPLLLNRGQQEPPSAVMEEPPPSPSSDKPCREIAPSDDPDFIGAEAALKRASAKAIQRALDAGLEPVVMPSENKPQ